MTWKSVNNLKIPDFLTPKICSSFVKNHEIDLRLSTKSLRKVNQFDFNENK